MENERKGDENPLGSKGRARSRPFRLTCSVDSGSPLPEAVVLPQKMKMLLALDVLLEIGPPHL